MHRLTGLFIASIACLAAGCQTAPPAWLPCHRPTAAATVTAQVNGEVAAPKLVVLAPAKATLRTAIQAAGGPSGSLDAAGTPFHLLAKVTRGADDYFISTDLIEDTSLGSLPLQDGEVITVVSWLDTDLSRTLVPVPNPVGENIYVYNQQALAVAYGLTSSPARSTAPRVTTSGLGSVVVSLARAQLTSKQLQYQFTSTSITDIADTPPQEVLVLNGQILPPKLSSLQPHAGSGTNVEEVFVVSRVADGRDTHIIFPRGSDKRIDGKIRENVAINRILEFAIILDGDVISLVDPAAVAVPRPAAGPSSAVRPKHGLPAHRPPGQPLPVAPRGKRLEFDFLPPILQP